MEGGFSNAQPGLAIKMVLCDRASGAFHRPEQYTIHHSHYVKMNGNVDADQEYNDNNIHHMTIKPSRHIHSIIE